MKRSIEVNGEIFEYSYIRKSTVRAYIRISNTAEILVTMPKHCTFAQIDDFILRKMDWIKSKIQSVKDSNSAKAKQTGQDEEWILYKGSKFPVQISLSKKVSIKLHDGILDMQLTLPKERIDVSATIVAWRKYSARYEYQAILDTMFEKVEYLGYKMPNLKIKKMTSRWGSYSRRTHSINMNSELLKAPIECIEFVIMHELCHLKHLDHSKNFYDLLTTLMPDHRQREKVLRDFCKIWQM